MLPVGKENESEEIVKCPGNFKYIVKRMARRIFARFKQRKEWLEETINLKEGEVCIANTNLLKRCWRLGRLIKTIPGKYKEYTRNQSSYVVRLVKKRNIMCEDISSHVVMKQC